MTRMLMSSLNAEVPLKERRFAIAYFHFAIQTLKLKYCLQILGYVLQFASYLCLCSVDNFDFPYEDQF
jgi:hypothetical protein